MTQAFNLSQFANNLDSTGRLDAADGLVNNVPVANGGTGAGTAPAARTNLGVPPLNGVGANGTWPISITGNAATTDSADAVITANFSMVEDGGKLYFRYQGNNIASLDSAGNFIALGNITAYTGP
jgi:hypothetical protein